MSDHLQTLEGKIDPIELEDEIGWSSSSTTR